MSTLGNHTSFPTGDDLKSVLTGLRFDPDVIQSLDDSGELTSAANSAAGEWERRTGWTPFIAGAPSTQFFYPDETTPGFLFLGSGIVSTPDPATGLNASVAIAFNGTSLVEGAGYVLQNQNAPAQGKPYTRIQLRGGFFCRYMGLGGIGSPAPTFAITARFGYCAILPDEVWDAALQYGQMLLTPSLGISVTGGLTAWTEGGVQQSASNGPFLTSAQAWEARWSRTLTNYRRVDVG